METHLTQRDILNYFHWKEDGGSTTIDTFKKLSKEEKKEIIEYLEDFSIYEEISLNGRKYILTHGDIHGASDEKPLEEHHFSHFVLYRADYTRRYYSDLNIFVVTGHTPTMLLNEDGSAKVFEGNGHIAIDCGCVYGKRLAAYCLNDGNVTYAESKNKY